MSEMQSTITDELSGGQKKRLMIALELLHNPPIIFLDEPTTGLDQLSSTQCVNVLQRLAHFGRTVVCSVHTPSAMIFNKFDHVYVIAAGQCAYRGTPGNVIPFLQSIDIECPKHYNPADFIIEISSGDYGLNLTERMIACVETKSPIVPISRSKYEFELDKRNPKVSWFHQFSTLVQRMTLQHYRNRNFIYLKVSLYVFLGLVIGLLFLNMGNDGSKTISNFGYCYACLIVLLYIPMLPVLLYFPSEIQLMKREHFNSWYELSAYYWALTIVTLPVQMLLAATYLSISYILTGQPLEWYRCCMFFSTCFMCCFIADSIGYSIASIFNVVNSVFVGPAFTCPLILLAIQGFGDSSPSPFYQKVLRYISYIRYGLEALTVSIYGYNRPRLPCPSEEIYCHFNSPKEVFQTLINTGSAPSFWFNMAVLVIVLMICKSSLYYLLRQRLQPNKTFQMLGLVGKLVKSYLNM